MGLACARKDSLPVAVSKTVTFWRIRSSWLNGAVAFTACVACTVSRISRVPLLLTTNSGQMVVALSDRCHSRCPYRVMTTNHGAFAEEQTVAAYSFGDKKSSRGAQTEST